jgi:hypothetical protein
MGTILLLIPPNNLVVLNFLFIFVISLILKKNIMYRVGVLYEKSKIKSLNFDTKMEMEDYILSKLDNPTVKKIRVKNKKTGEVYNV